MHHTPVCGWASLGPMGIGGRVVADRQRTGRGSATDRHDFVVRKAAAALKDVAAGELASPVRCSLRATVEATAAVAAMAVGAIEMEAPQSSGVPTADIGLVIDGTRCLVGVSFIDVYTGGGGLRQQGARYEASVVAGVLERGKRKMYAAAIGGGADFIPLVFEPESRRVGDRSTGGLRRLLDRRRLPAENRNCALKTNTAAAVVSHGNMMAYWSVAWKALVLCVFCFVRCYRTTSA